MIELRLRSRISEDELKEKVGKILTDDDYNLLVTRAARVLKPDGSPLAVYLPGVLAGDMLDGMYPILHSLRKMETNNRGLASGTPTGKRNKDSERHYSAKSVASAIIGAYDGVKPRLYCRLTAWTGKQFDQFEALFPLFQSIAALFAKYVPSRYEAQMVHVRQTQPEWLIAGTPFTTITVNNTYPTGVHVDKGDLVEGFSTLATLRRGSYTGGRLVFPEFRVAVDMHDGDVLLMDAHEWHGNTRIVCACGLEPNGVCETCEAERISIVSYYRTNMASCGSPEEEAAKAEGIANHLIDLQAAEALG
jgi:hypothetical protein